MGNSCTKQSMEVQPADHPVTSQPVEENNNQPMIINKPVHPNLVQAILEPYEETDSPTALYCKLGDRKCEEYVDKVIGLKSTSKCSEVDGTLAECLADVPEMCRELTFQFDLNKISNNNEDMDQVDGLSYQLSSGDSVENLVMNSKKCRWSRARNKPVDYLPPSDSFTVCHEESINVANREKRKIYSISDLHLGGIWSVGMEAKVNKYLEHLQETASEQMAVLVLLGDIYEMWLDKFHHIPANNTSLVNLWKSSAPDFVHHIKTLADKHSVKIFYVRGNHDREITEKDVQEIFEGRVTFVEDTLILHVKCGEELIHRVRFSHGHQFDIFNSYILENSDALLNDRPIGYYIARAVATSGRGDSGSDLEEILISMAGTLLSVIPSDLEDNLVNVLLSEENQRKLISQLFESAFHIDNIDLLKEAKCRVSDEFYIRLQSLLKYPLLLLSSLLVGKVDVFHMIKASTGDYKLFLKRSREDVVIFAHTHLWDLKKYKTFAGNQLIYANTGCWTCKAKEMACVILNPPTDDSDGEVYIDHCDNK